MSDPIAEAADAISAGELVIFPTDTVYGLAARPDAAAATRRLFAAKERSEDLALPVLAGSTEDARSLAVFDERAELLARAWPGPVTLVLMRNERSRGWDLGGRPDTVGVRIPKHPLALALLSRTGPLATTSANRSGEPPLQDGEALWEVFGDRVAVYLCQDAPLSGAPSTVVDLTTSEVVILRDGALARGDVARFLTEEGPLLDSRPSP